MPLFFKSKTPTINAEDVPLKYWTADNFRQWLEKQKYDNKTVINVLVKQHFDGTALLCCTADDFIQIGVPKGSALSIHYKINELKSQQTHRGILRESFAMHNTPQQQEVVMEEEQREKKDEEVEEVEAKELAVDLNDETAVEKTDPSTSDDSTSTISHSSSSSTNFQLIPEAPVWKIDKLSPSQKKNYDYCLQKLDHLKSQFDSDIISSICQNLIFSERFLYKYLNPQRLPIYTNNGMRKVPFMKIKLVVTEMSSGVAHRLLRRLGSKVKHSTIKRMEFGMFHTALICGPWYLEWCCDSLAIVRKKSSSKAIFVADVTEVRGEENVRNTIEKLAMVCSYWNAHKMYDNKTCNCQHFCMSVLDFLGLTNEYEKSIKGPMKTYIDRLKNNGICDMKYYLEPTLKDTIMHSDCSEELKKFVSQSSKKVVFTSHKILDEFVHVIQHHKPLYFEANGNYDYLLLKGFDRAFWLRSQSSSKTKDNDVQPLRDEKNTVLCPFSKCCGGEIHNGVVGKDYELDGISIDLPEFAEN
ncbi:hypothetical protein ABK040_011914 [Willaertia magna]